DGEDDQAVDLAGVTHADAGDPAGLVHLAGGVVVADLDAEDVRLPHVDDERGGDGVEHDRGDDLADAAGDLQDTGDTGPEGAGENGGQEQQRDLEERRQGGVGTDDGGHHGAELVLAVDADVEEVHPEADGDREGGDVVHRRLVDDQDLD